MNPIAEHNLAAIRALGRDFGVARLKLFGSACTPNFDPAQSDIDILVEFPPDYGFGPWLKRFHELQRALAALLDHDVDLIDVWALRNPWFSREAAKTRQVVYDASDIVQSAQRCAGSERPHPGACCSLKVRQIRTPSLSECSR